MPTNRTKTARYRKPSTNLDETIRDFLFYGPDFEIPRGSPGWSLRITRFFEGSEIRDVWLEHCETLMLEWKKTKRPGLPWGAQFDKKGEKNHER